MSEFLNNVRAIWSDRGLERRALLAVVLVLAALALLTYTSVFAETVTYEYDPNGNLLTRQTPTQTDSANYDALDRLIADQFGTLPPVQYGYDANGNRTNQLFDGFSETCTYAANTNRLIQKGTQTLTYDAAGNLLDDGQGNTYTYNNAGRLAQVFRNGVLVATYIYNANGQRTRKVTQQGTTVYHYDINGNLIAESTGSGTPKREYLYVDNIPIAQIDIGATDIITYLHTDHLGTPRIGTDANGKVVWSWAGDAFGSLPPNEDPDGDGITTTVNLRMAGQYFDQESGLFYNWNRYYDPKIGRYITSDPIGLRGGDNGYRYSLNNPLRYTDPAGLAETGAKIGGAIAGTIGFIGGGIGGGAAGLVVCSPTGPGALGCAGAGAVAGALEGAAILGVGGAIIGSAIEDACKPKDDHCEKLYKTDTDTCNGITRVRGNVAGARCHASASQRFAACLRGQPLPPLDTWNN